MSSSIVNLFRPFQRAVRVPGWSNQEKAEFYRVQELLAKVGIAVELDFGVSDDDSPWACFVAAATGDVVIHFAVIDGCYVASSEMGSRGFRGSDFRKVIDAMLAASEQKASITRDRRDPSVTIHPASVLACLIIVMLCSDGALAFEGLSPAGEHGAPISKAGTEKLIASVGAWDQADEEKGGVDARRDRAGAGHSGFLAQQLAHEVATYSGSVRSAVVLVDAETSPLLPHRRSGQGPEIETPSGHTKADPGAAQKAEATLSVAAEMLPDVTASFQEFAAPRIAPASVSNARASVSPPDGTTPRSLAGSSEGLKGGTIADASGPDVALADRGGAGAAKPQDRQAILIGEADSAEIRLSLNEMVADEAFSSVNDTALLGDYFSETPIIIIAPEDDKAPGGQGPGEDPIDLELILLEQDVNEFIETAGSIGVVVDGDDIYIFDLDVFDAPGQALWIETIDADFGGVVLVGLALDFP